MNRSSYEVGSTKSNNNKRRRTAKSNATTVNNNLVVNKSSSDGSVSSVFNELLILNSSTSPMEDGSQKPRSHANARERDRTHRCVYFYIYSIILAASS